ncbi:acetate--CoA ligase [Hahella sp. HN01]|uniref:acetate--CoA ligase n=1 Tax=Hahella sp. HN01 TaxID=2847262 RepID=UPI001C1ED52C|nr:acetate--CoA ligase [Hahella sp. HN01]MBU6949778.1 acetate--CoA ligase [Hahella sp. HN01]
MSASTIYSSKAEIIQHSFLDEQKYQDLYRQSITEPEKFWAEHAQRLDWFKPFSKVKDTSFQAPDVHIRWFEDGYLNVSHNCLDRHLEQRGDQTAIIWQGDDPNEHKHISYRELHAAVCRFANVLKAQGVAKGDVVTLYMPMIPETAVAMLACTRIGAVHSVVFGGFSPEALASRILNGRSKLVITADEGLRGGKTIPLKANVDAALARPGLDMVEKVIVVKRTGADVAWREGRDLCYQEVMAQASDDCPAEVMNAEDPLFILYTSGSTGAPKGVLHTTGGYLTYVSLSHQYVFNYREGDVFWCTADFGWITGHSYVLYGPLSNGATTLVYEGVPNYPDLSRFWRIVEQHKVNLFYTAPTAIRAIMAAGDELAQAADRSSLRVMGSCGEPINPEAWEWFYRVVGDSRCPIMDTWWQTETGGIMITPIAGVNDLKPGSATRPFFGVQPALVDNEGNEISGAGEGNLIIKDSWPAQMRTVYGDHDRFVKTYFSTFNDAYFTGDGARRDEDGYYWITGRVDDVINVSGHRMGTAEVESALVSHPKVAEAAVVGYPHAIKGQGIYVYITLNVSEAPTDALKEELRQWVRKEIGPVASPDVIQWAPGLPKTRSGKIMRRILRKIAADEHDNLGDVSTLADPSVVDELIANRVGAP